MIRFLVTYAAPADPGAFDRHYDEVHVPIARSLPGLRRFTLSRNVRGADGEPFHLVAELDWDTVDDLRAAFASPQGAAAAADVATMDVTVRSMTYEVEEVAPSSR